MNKSYQLDKSFGPVGASAGMLLFFVGLIITYFSFSGLIIVIFGAFVGFSSTSTTIDSDKKRIKFSNNIFGIIQFGKWVNIESGMRIGLIKSTKVWRAFSLSNRTFDAATNDIRIILYNSKNIQLMPIAKYKTLDSAKAELEIICNLLGLTS